MAQVWHHEASVTSARWRRLLLPASLILNLFFIALVAGHWLHEVAVRNAMPRGMIGEALAHAEASLDAKDAAAFRAVLRQNRAQFSDTAEKLAAARRDVEVALTAEPYDRDAARKALTAWREQWVHFFGDFTDTLVDALADVSLEGRRRIIDDRQRADGPAKP